MITEQHISIVNESLSKFGVKLIPNHYKINNRIRYAEDDSGNSLCIANTVEDLLVLQVDINGFLMEIKLPLDFTKEYLLSAINKDLEEQLKVMLEDIVNIKNTLVELK